MSERVNGPRTRVRTGSQKLLSAQQRAESGARGQADMWGVVQSMVETHTGLAWPGEHCAQSSPTPSPRFKGIGWP